MTPVRAQTQPLDLESSKLTIRVDCPSPNSFIDLVYYLFSCAVYNPESSLETKVQAITNFVESHAAQLSKVYSHAVFQDVFRMFVPGNISVDVFRTGFQRAQIGQGKF